MRRRRPVLFALGVATMEAFVIGERVNNYLVVSRLATGGMGTVYVAENPYMGRRAAIKVLHPEYGANKVQVNRFMNEARAANAIRHPNIIDILDAGFVPTSGLPYLVMELLEGETLEQRLIRLGRLPMNQAVGFAKQIASALSAVHAKSILHRDLKPDNLFLVPDEHSSLGARVKVLDFGIAKLRNEMGGKSIKTRTGAVLGTPIYMSPEQCRGVAEDVDHRTDIYSLGIIMYEMVCGQPPFRSEGYGDVMMMHIGEEPVAPRTVNPQIPESLERVILKTLAKKRDDRYANMGELEHALDWVSQTQDMDLPVASHHPTIPQLDLPLFGDSAVVRRRKRLIFGGAVGLGVALLVVEGMTALGGGTPAATHQPSRPTSGLPDKAAASGATALPAAPSPTVGDVPEVGPARSGQDLAANSRVSSHFRREGTKRTMGNKAKEVTPGRHLRAAKW